MRLLHRTAFKVWLRRIEQEAAVRREKVGGYPKRFGIAGDRKAAGADL